MPKSRHLQDATSAEPEPPIAIESPVGVVLAGGASRRMGRDKAHLLIDGITWLDHAAQRLAKVCEQVVIADRRRDVSPAWPSVDDAEGRGPAAGILGASRQFPQRDLLVLACDLLAIPVELLHHLATDSTADLVIPYVEQRFEPLCALYRYPALEALGLQVAAGDYALKRLAESITEGEKPLAVHRIEEGVVERWGNPKILFSNLNTPQALNRFRETRQRSPQ